MRSRALRSLIYNGTVSEKHSFVTLELDTKVKLFAERKEKCSFSEVWSSYSRARRMYQVKMLNRTCLVACRVQLVDSQDPGRRQVTGMRKRLPEVRLSKAR